jgi:hypothetical protein
MYSNPSMKIVRFKAMISMEGDTLCHSITLGNIISSVPDISLSVATDEDGICSILCSEKIIASNFSNLGIDDGLPVHIFTTQDGDLLIHASKLFSVAISDYQVGFVADLVAQYGGTFVLDLWIAFE